MDVLAVFLVGAFVAGGSRRTSILRRRWIVALAVTTLFAAAYDRLGVIM